MKKTKYNLLICLMFLTIILLSGCANQELQVKFSSFSLGKRETDYYLDFLIQINNTYDYEQYINNEDFTLIVNDTEVNECSFLNAFEDVYLLKPTINKKENIKIRVRFIYDLNQGEYNTLQLKFRNTILIEDKLYTNQ